MFSMRLQPTLKVLKKNCSLTVTSMLSRVLGCPFFSFNICSISAIVVFRVWLVYGPEKQVRQNHRFNV